MDKNSPVARGVRTFVTLLAGSAIAWAGIDWVADWRPGAVLVTLNVIAAALGGLGAFLLALGDLTADSPTGKATATLLQAVGSFAATYVVADLTAASAVDFGRALASVITSAVTASVISFLVNSAEDGDLS
jgi:hypothetical protein